MTGLSIDFCKRAAAARRDARLSQSALAREIGCMQSALSMFEAGFVTKLSAETVKKLSERLGIPLAEPQAPPEPAAVPPPLPGAYGYCPSCSCISNIPYAVDGRLFFRPLAVKVFSAAPVHCTSCGEILETSCPACGAPVNEGACCAACGSPYVAAPPVQGDISAWAAERRSEIAGIRGFN